MTPDKQHVRRACPKGKLEFNFFFKPWLLIESTCILVTTLRLTAFVASDKSAKGVLGWIYGDIHCSKSSRRNCSQDLMSSFSGWGMRGSVTTIALSSSLSYRSWSSFCAWLNRAPTEIWKIVKNKLCLAKSKDYFTSRIPENTQKKNTEIVNQKLGILL